MIISLLLIIGSFLMRIVASMMSAFQMVLPEYMYEMLNNFVSWLMYANAYLPLVKDLNADPSSPVYTHGMFDTGAIAIQFMIALLAFKLVFRMLSFIQIMPSVIRIGTLLKK